MICRSCGRDLPLTDFTANRSRKNGYETRCHQCTAEYYRQYNQKNRAKIKQQKIDYETRIREEEAFFNNQKFNSSLGGHKIYVLNHVKDGEFKYNIVSTLGEVFKTNDKIKFINYLTEL